MVLRYCSVHVCFQWLYSIVTYMQNFETVQHVTVPFSLSKDVQKSDESPRCRVCNEMVRAIARIAVHTVGLAASLNVTLLEVLKCFTVCLLFAF